MKILENTIRLMEPYTAKLNVKETQKALNTLKQAFELHLSTALNLTRVSTPLFVLSGTGINDNLNGMERPVQFTALELGDQSLEIVHSLAKWKRMALKRYGFEQGEGLFTHMNAIRRDEGLDHLHSIYVDQWDWERVIDRQERTLTTLRQTVEKIYGAMKETERVLVEQYPGLNRKLPESITFLTAQELENRFPHLPAKEREDAITREYGAVFVMQIGGKLESGIPHDGRSPDYDDWQLNGDILVWNPILKSAFELSSMGIRVDEVTLRHQLEEAGCPERCTLEFHKQLLEGQLPYTIGGGIGQSRLGMFFLEKAHIGEIQASVWPSEMKEVCESANIFLL
ncbi:aspartate--ammonia ligase [Paenibacillus sp. N10]|uniref:Aspartate--ammonia ligase n=2 Tax=Paenibacillus lutrae TaxID=2078573 RepID=A0A7X3FHV7_9BACL|nr:aspartate--ammonia ligase [Paenibacillus lutrae]